MIEHLEGTFETISYRTENGIKLYRNISTESFPAHWHIGVEIIFPIINSYTVRVNHAEIPIQPNDIIIIAAGQLHSLTAPSTYGERLILQIDYQKLSSQREIHSLLHFMNPYYLIRSSESNELCQALGQCLYKIEEEYNRSDKFYETYIYSLFEQFFVSIGRHHLKSVNEQLQKENQQDDKSNSHNVEQFINICDYISQNYQNNPSLERAALKTGYSKSHFCRFFKHYSGKSYYDYLLEIKVSHSANLLSSTDRRITDIAMECGFNSVSTFNRVFQQFYRCTPSQYRKLQIK